MMNPGLCNHECANCVPPYVLRTDSRDGLQGRFPPQCAQNEGFSSLGMTTGERYPLVPSFRRLFSSSSERTELRRRIVLSGPGCMKHWRDASGCRKRAPPRTAHSDLPSSGFAHTQWSCRNDLLRNVSAGLPSLSCPAKSHSSKRRRRL